MSKRGPNGNALPIASGSAVPTAVLGLLAAGLSVVPIKPDGSKKPTVAWKQFQMEPMTADQARRCFANGEGVAIIGGAVSRNTEILDFDAPELFDPWRELVEGEVPGLVERLVRVKTPKGGDHIYYRCPLIASNQKLARAPGDPDKRGRPTVRVLIETRGEGGYVLSPPSPPACHPSGRPYLTVAGSLLSIPTITVADREVLLRVARSFNRVPNRIENGGRDNKTTRPANGTRPGDEFNARASWDEILRPEGWEPVRTYGDVTYWRKPGSSDRGHHATTGAASDHFYCFSTAAHPFEAETAYSKFAALALLKHGGDFAAAARALAAAGYGTRATKVGDARSKAETEIGDAASKAAELAEKITDTGNAERLIKLHGMNLRYCWPWKKWLAWTGPHWSDDAEAEVFKRAKATARSIFNEVAGVADDSEAKRLANHGRISMSSRSLRAMIDLARPELPIKPDEVDRDPWALNVTNGTVDLRTRQLRSHRREDYITQLAPVEYSPGARAPEFERFMLGIMGGKPHLVAYLQRVFGYCATGSVREDALWIFHGSGLNGKSTLLGAVAGTLGPHYAATLAPAMLLTRKHDAHPAELADLFGKRLCYTHEIDEGRKLAEGIAKQLSGRDHVKARRMRENFWEFAPTHKIILAVNHRPEIRGTDEAIWRRIRLVPFNESFKGREDKKLPEKLHAERAGVLAWLVRGAVEWYEHGLNDPDEVVTATQDYRNESDPIADFLIERCDEGNDLAGLPFRVKAGKLYEAFVSWFHRERGGEPLSGRAFGDRMTVKFKKTREEGGNWYLGLKLRTDDPGTESEF